MKNFFLLLVVSVLLVLSGCAASILKADKASQLQAKSFIPKAGMSNIYVYRPSGFMASALNYHVTVDKQLVGDIESGSFSLIEVPPGKHTVSTTVITIIGSSSVPDAAVELDTEAGHNYYLWQDVDDGAINKLHQVNEATGKRDVANCSMIPVPDNVIKSIAAATKRNQQTVVAKPYTPPQVNKLTKAPAERLVLMPLRVGEEDKRLQGAMETALVQGLQQNYIVFAGEQVAQKAHEIFLKESRNTAKKECDETRCMQGIAEAFQAELIATANVTKQDGGYFLSLSIQNIFDNKVVYSNSVPCRNCDSFQVVDKLKELSYPSP
jgi:hypothetical protein